MYENVLRRATLGKDVVPLKPRVVVSATGDVREELSFHLRDYLRYEDLFLYGMTPQFISRFESIVALNDLSEGDLARIFVEPDASIFRTSRDYFKRFNIDLQITKGAIRAIAWDASRQKRLGARALKEVYRRVIRGLEFDPRGKGSPGVDGRQIVTVDEDMVRQAIRIREQGSAQGS
jgi:ATP-dependent protease Clp ATPase subunit